jgi:hypothetical protein
MMGTFNGFLEIRKRQNRSRLAQGAMEIKEVSQRSGDVGFKNKKTRKREETPRRRTRKIEVSRAADLEVETLFQGSATCMTSNNLWQQTTS